MNTFAPLQKCAPLLFSGILSLGSIACSAQTTSSVTSIPANVKQASEQKAVDKSNSVSKDALNLADSSSTKVWRGIKGAFKKKKHPAPATDTTAPKDSTGVHPASSSMIILPADDKNASKKQV